MLTPWNLWLLPVILQVSAASPAKLHSGYAQSRTERDRGCNEDEYFHEGKCCKLCPAGTHVSRHCTENHTHGDCGNCAQGEDFTAYANSMEKCLHCRKCKEDKVMVHECTPKTDRECECKAGTFCIPGESCEMCNRCSRCGEGQRIKEKCTSTADTVCEDVSAPEPTSTNANVKSGLTVPVTTKSLMDETGHKSDPWITLAIVLLAAFLIAIIVIATIFAVRSYWKRKAKEKAEENSLFETTPNNSENTSMLSIQTEGKEPKESKLHPEHQRLMTAEDGKVENLINQRAEPYEPGGETESGENSIAEPLEGNVENEENPQLGAACQDCGEVQPCDRTWDIFFYTVIENVQPGYILQLVRKLHLHKATTEQILKDNPNDCKEQNYKLLRQWRDQKGKQASMRAVLRELQDMALGGCCQNIENSLRTKKVPMN